MDCTSESASHYAGCSCNEEHWRAKLAASEAAREKAEAEKNAALQRAWRAEAEAALKVGMRRELEQLLGVRDTTDPLAFEDGLIRLRELVAAEARLAEATACLEEIAASCECGFPRCEANRARAFLASEARRGR